jgi:hypothetical protein
VALQRDRNGYRLACANFRGVGSASFLRAVLAFEFPQTTVV